jgi:Protein of unknown function (DUF493)
MYLSLVTVTLSIALWASAWRMFVPPIAIFATSLGLLDKPAGNGNFLALTYLVCASSREQLDETYRELTACKSVLMAL